MCAFSVLSRVVFLTMAFHVAMAGQGQVVIQLRDTTTNKPVSHAHIAYQVVPDGASGMLVTGTDGGALLPIDTLQPGQGVALRITFVGYLPLADTLRSLATRTYLLKPSAHALPELVVTGQYAPIATDLAVHKVRVLDDALFKRMAANNLADALRNELNIRLQQDNVLGTSLSMMGMGGENVKVLVDGVPIIGRLDGALDLSQLDLTGIERAEVIEGPLSVSYGTNALAGTINLITRKGGNERSTFKAQVHAEHIGRLNTTFTGTHRWGRHHVSLNMGRNFFGGWDPDDTGLPSFAPAPADSGRVQQWKPREQFFARLNYGWHAGRWTFGYKGEGMSDLIVVRGSPRPPFFITAFDEQYRTTRLDNALFAEGRVGEHHRVKAHAAHNRYARTRNTWFRDLTTLGEELADIPGMQDTTRFSLTNLRATFGSTRPQARLRYEVGTDLNYETGSGERMGSGPREIGDAALFASAEYVLFPELTIRPGVRMAWNSRYDAPVLPSLNLRWALSNHFVARASYARGFRAPALKELYLDFVDVNHDIVGNPALEAERSHNLSAGMTYRHARERGVYRSEITGFYNALEDLITLVQLEGASYTYVNIGSFTSAGGTVGASWENDRWLVSVGGGVTGRYDALSAAQQEPWLFSPEVRGSITHNWIRSSWTASLFWKYQGEVANYVQRSDVEVVRGFIAPFHRADLTIGKRLWDGRLGLSAGCRDLLNVVNVEASIAGGVHSTGASSVPMTTGRTWFVRIDLDLKAREQ